MIKVKKVSKWFGTKQAVSELSFTISKGEVLGFIGPNGAGKSTTMRMITGFIPCSEGSIFIDGHNIETDPLLAKSKFGYLPENAPLYTNKTVKEFLGFIAEIRGFYGKEKKKKVASIIKKCFLEPVENQIIDTLSKGYKHRTCFAQSILHDPEILILDEPTDGLDPNQKREIRNLIKEMGKTKAIILSTHILEEIEAVSNRVLLISSGAKVFDGTPAELKQQSKNAGTIILSLAEATIEEVKEALINVKCIENIDIISQQNDIINLRISHTENKKEKISQNITKAILKDNLKFIELKIEQGNLEEVFAKLTLENNKDAK